MAQQPYSLCTHTLTSRFRNKSWKDDSGLSSRFPHGLNPRAAVLRIRDVYPRIPRIPYPDFSIQDPHKKFEVFLTQKIVSKLSEICSSRIRILIFNPSRIQGSKRHRIPEYCLVAYLLSAAACCACALRSCSSLLIRSAFFSSSAAFSLLNLSKILTKGTVARHVDTCFF